MKSELAVEISSELVRSALFEIIEEQLKSKKYQVTVGAATKADDLNFTGIVYRVLFNKEDEAETGKSTASSIILKIAPQNLARRNQFNVRPAFLREIYTYDKILPLFHEFERSKGVDIKKNGFTEHPNCYRTINVDINEGLLLEDLCIRGFSTIDRRNDVMTAEHVRLVMQGFAKFHAISFALKDQHPEKFNDLTSNLSEVFICKTNTPLRYCLSEQAKGVFKALSDEEELLAKVKKFYEKEALDIAADCIDLESTGSASVITYGDVHQNNILFKNDANGKPNEASFLDWQAVRHASPVLDIAFFIFCSTTKEVRDVYYGEFLQVYHETLTEHIRRLGSDPKKLFPRKLMLDHLRKFAKFGFIMSTVLLPVITFDGEYKPNFEEIGENAENGTLEDTSVLVSENSINMLNKRFRDIAADMVRLEYIHFYSQEQIMTDSALTEIPSEYVRTAAIETLKNELNSDDFSIKVTSASKAGEDNFIGIIYRVSCSKQNEKSPTNFIIKVAPQNLLRRSQFVVRPAFVREIYSYEKMLPILRQFEQSKGIQTHGFTEYPKCYLTVDVDINEGLIFEDLCERGFVTIDRRTEEVTVDHLRLVMQSLGKLHATSFALKDQQPDKFNEIVSNLSEVFIRADDPHLRECFTKQSQLVFDVLSAEEDVHLLAKVKRLFEKEAIDIAADCIDLKLTGPAYVIAYGDAWQNNSMFRYDDNGKPVEVCFLDWQTVRASSPIIDIVYYVFCCTTKELRDAYYDELLHIYHDSLAAHMKRLGSDPETIFPYKLMMEHFRKFAKFGLVLSTVLLPMITSEIGSGLDLDGMGDKASGDGTNSDNFISEESRNKLNKRLRDVIIDMARLEYI
ncbi:uncharacterized protein LOC129568559 [Sitodiplosis mosellana]|uniref:uncharacterized protein LOC129568559 n=1 Tax=Sitodiplosis mosellana TaxID=263140 RepID=UPI00244418D0|nr:uncharacterized protein LOC129568559 [Sitodiplosis mosellana]